MILFLFLFLWFGFWSAQAGYSINFLDGELQSWQQHIPYGDKIPETIIALSFALIGIWGWGKLFDISTLWTLLIFAVFFAVSYAGKQSATWAYLTHEGYKDPDTTRTSTLKPINDYIGAQFGYKLGDEGYSWIWAATKGFITTAPVGFFGAVFQPLGREIASHAKGRLKGDSNFYMEFVGDGLGYSVACFVFMALIRLIG